LWYFPRLTLGTQILLALGLSMVLGWLSWNLIEKRCLAWKTTFPNVISLHIGVRPSHRAIAAIPPG
jgi:peptidoglycan/LPS O-acetylase OafA/YrhL